MLTKEQTQSIKAQILEHIESTFPDEKKETAISQLESMSDEELEQFLKKSGSLKEDAECIFCSIIQGEAPSYKIYEDENSLAVLEINPTSKGHIILIPKIHSQNIPGSVYDLSKKLSEKISLILKPKKIDIVDSELFGHKIINLLPIYNDENIHSKRIKAEEKELADLQKMLTLKNDIKPESENKPIKNEEKNPSQKIITENEMWLPRRIP